jgi:hypothetical protein
MLDDRKPRRSRDRRGVAARAQASPSGGAHALAGRGYPDLVSAGATLAFRSLFAPSVLALRWLLPRPATAGAPAAPVGPRSTGLRLKVAADELFFAIEMLSAPVVAPAEHRRLRDEVARALALYEERGWLDRPPTYHRPPAPLVEPAVRARRAWGHDFQHLVFASGYEPHAGEPGRERWLARVANRTAHAWVLEHPGAARPWLVCVPGYRMGHPHVDFAGFPVRWVHRHLGLNVAIPVLPLHGPRADGARSGDGFLTGDYVDTVHLQAQAVWDVRRLLGWVRARGPAAGLYGISLGGCTTALVASLEDDLACAIAGIPATCFLGVTRWNIPPPVLRVAEQLGVAWSEVARLLRVVSPLALAPRVGRDRRFIYAASADRLVPPDGVQALWEHWERPRLEWYEGSHLSFRLESKVRALVHEALARSGLA